MKLMPTPTRDELKTLLESIIEIRNKKVYVKNQPLMRKEVITQLAFNSLFAEASIRQTSQKAIWQISQYMGTPYATPENFLTCILRDGIDSMKIPTVNIEWIPIEILESIIEACNEMEVGPILFLIDRSHPEVKGFVSTVLAVTVKKQFQAPVLFYDAETPLPFETELLDWKKLLYFNSFDLPEDNLKAIQKHLIQIPFKNLTENDWKKIITLSEEDWVDLRENLYDAYCDLFEEFDVNETFVLLKRYLIPSLSKQTISNIL